MDARGEEQGQDSALRNGFETLGMAMKAAAATRRHGPGDMPSLPEIRQLLRLFARLPSHDTRQAVLALLRTIVDAA